MFIYEAAAYFPQIEFNKRLEAFSQRIGLSVCRWLCDSLAARESRPGQWRGYITLEEWGVRSQRRTAGDARSANISTQKQHNTAISVHTRRPNRSDVTRSKSAINLPLLKLQIDVLNDIKIPLYYLFANINNTTDIHWYINIALLSENYIMHNYATRKIEENNIKGNACISRYSLTNIFHYFWCVRNSQHEHRNSILYVRGDIIANILVLT